MDADEYQVATRETANYKDKCETEFEAMFYVALGLAGEAGEICNKMKKMLRDGVSKEEMREFLRGELGDAQWYLGRLADDFNLTLSEIMEANIDKLRDRKARGVIGGSGDDR